MNIALLNQKITIQKEERVVDEIGNQNQVWLDFMTRFATISGQNQVEINENGALWDENKIDFTIRYSKNSLLIDSKSYRVIFQNEVYDILGIDYQNFKKKSLKIKCVKQERNKYEG